MECIFQKGGLVVCGGYASAELAKLVRLAIIIEGCGGMRALCGELSGFGD